MERQDVLARVAAIKDGEWHNLGRIHGTGEQCDQLDREVRAMGFLTSWRESFPPQLVVQRRPVPIVPPAPPVSLEAVAKGLLLFHSGGGWDADRQIQWEALGFGPDCTSKALCDAARAALGVQP